MMPCLLNCQSFTLVLNALQDGVAIYDQDGTLIWVNSKACQILGTLREELIGRNVSEIATFPTVRTIVSSEFAGRSLTEIRVRYTRIEDYTSPGYAVFTNGKQVLYMNTFVRDPQGAIQ
jgi:PAS domain S-box-containing protein